MEPNTLTRVVRPLFKTTIEIWSEYDGTSVEIEDLARDATSGGSICSSATSVLVETPEEDASWPAIAHFFETEGWPYA